MNKLNVCNEYLFPREILQKEKKKTALIARRTPWELNFIYNTSIFYVFVEASLAVSISTAYYYAIAGWLCFRLILADIYFLLLLWLFECGDYWDMECPLEKNARKAGYYRQRVRFVIKILLIWILNAVCSNKNGQPSLD